MEFMMKKMAALLMAGMMGLHFSWKKIMLDRSV